MRADAPRLDIVLPVLDEAATLQASVETVHAFLTASTELPSWQITIADSASTDGTGAIADLLAARLPSVRNVHLPRKGRGLALRTAWLSSPCEVLAYMDIDLSTDLRALAPLVAPLLSGHSDLAVGSRLLPAARVIRGARRETLSRGYNLLLHGTLGAGFSDAQCGFKAITSRAAHHLLPLVEDPAWFFDTELLVLAQRSGLRIAEVPVDWYDDPESSVDVAGTVREDLRGIARMARDLTLGRIPLGPVAAELGRRPLHRSRSLASQLVSFGGVGALSTLAFTGLYLLLQLALPHQAANLLALATATVLNTAVNRRLTFGVLERAGAGVHLIQGTAMFLVTWAITAGALALAHLGGHPSAAEDVLVLTAANALATVLRFLVLRRLFARPTDDAPKVLGEDVSHTRRELTGS
ncbi:glycosyltransferase [Brachybacterium halotolerans subsp. kimchii]|uniref:glycosyltransferase n=1 Tax=Brachybacterium halotolerans TaxID=2795215 RepID=UPI001E424B98|nr:glycosyltransferase [Brachybacterium halotolerans]UEJ83825.1 glycosyltransferase [Brachybacterium halotolerans subsp. kimchii]